QGPRRSLPPHQPRPAASRPVHARPQWPYPPPTPPRHPPPRQVQAPPPVLSRYAERIACHWPAPVMTNSAALLAAIANATFAASAFIFSPVAGYTFMLLAAAALMTIRSSPVTSCV